MANFEDKKVTLSYTTWKFNAHDEEEEILHKLPRTTFARMFQAYEMIAAQTPRKDTCAKAFYADITMEGGPKNACYATMQLGVTLNKHPKQLCCDRQVIDTNECLENLGRGKCKCELGRKLGAILWPEMYAKNKQNTK